VGAIIPIKVGDQLTAGDLVGTVHASDKASLALARKELLHSITWSQEPVEALPHFYDTLT
jgi:hypothetical protein